ESGPVAPRKLVANLKPRVLDRAREPVIAARAAERRDVAAGLQLAQDFGPKLDGESRFSSVPRLRHKTSRSARINVSLRRSRAFLAETLDDRDQRVRRVRHH